MAKKAPPPPAPAPAPAPAQVAAPKGKAVAAAATASTAVARTSIADLILQDAANKPHFDRQDMAIPFLRVLQSNSPQVDTEDDRHVEGSAVGDFINTATLEMWDGKEGVVIIPCAFTRSFTEWIPRKQGGGFVKDWGVDDPRPKLHTVRDPETGKDTTPDGTEILFAGMYFIFIVDPETGAREQAAFALAGTQMKKSKAWAIQMELYEVEVQGQLINPAMFYRSYKVTTVPEENKKGKWRGVKIEPFLPTLELPEGEAIYLDARNFERAVTAGEVKVKMDEEVLDVEAEAETVAAPPAAAARPASAQPRKAAAAPQAPPPPEQPPEGDDDDKLPF